MKNDGGQAFPSHPEAFNGSDYGMSLRDYQATQFAAAIINAAGSWGACEFKKDIDFDAVAEVAYMASDAMLAEKDK